MICVRPMPTTSSGQFQTLAQMRANDLVRCLCGQPSCRDSDLKRDKS